MSPGCDSLTCAGKEAEALWSSPGWFCTKGSLHRRTEVQENSRQTALAGRVTTTQQDCPLWEDRSVPGGIICPQDRTVCGRSSWQKLFCSWKMVTLAGFRLLDGAVPCSTVMSPQRVGAMSWQTEQEHTCSRNPWVFLWGVWYESPRYER